MVAWFDTKLDGVASFILDPLFLTPPLVSDLILKNITSICHSEMVAETSQMLIFKHYTFQELIIPL